MPENGLQELEELALNLRSVWNRSTDVIWRALNADLWETTRNPWAVLQTFSKEMLTQKLQDTSFRTQVAKLAQCERDTLQKDGWFQTKHANSSLRTVAYFSMEFMLSEALRIYSGGLGNVAGDQLKAASDLGVPVIGVGLLYAQGYFRQFIDANGEQKELYPYNDPGQLPVKPLRLPTGEWLRLKLDWPGGVLYLRTWEVRVGRCKLYLLDSNDLANDPLYRGITSELYGGNLELRLQQELILGLGGWGVLQALKISPEVCHMNEGHAAFAVLQRAAQCMQETKLSFDEALEATRAGNLFTTHTAVSAGFDRFPTCLIRQYLSSYAEKTLHISIEELLSLGQIRPGDDFNMAYLAIRGSGFINGVSRLHGAVSRRLFRDLFPRVPEKEVPIGYVTNGVHVPSWDSAAADECWAKHAGQGRWLQETEHLCESVRKIAPDKIWEMRNSSRQRLVEYARARLAKQLAARGAEKEEIERGKTALNPKALTLGFARRFAEYKRPDLLLYDEERFRKILTQKDRPVQLILAGKAHPADGGGHALIRRWVQWMRQFQDHVPVVFLSDYDMILTEYLVQGVDVWINTPRRPWEASGTSGMKVLVNGGLNLSELDGWWAEAYSPDVGWAIGDGKEHGGDPNVDREEASALYDLLEQHIIPEFYERDNKGLPTRWLSKIQESMARLTPRYCTNRVVREYTEQFYLPAAEQYAKRSAKQGALAKELAAWKQKLQMHWHELQFGDLHVDQGRLTVEVMFGSIAPKDVRVELYSEESVQEMKDVGASGKGRLYGIECPKGRSVSDFTPRLVPRHENLRFPLECGLMTWQK